MAVFFVFFFSSGFCSLVYQVVWLRMAMADFGVTTPQVSIVLSVFMAGLALGSWGGGRLVRRFADRSAGFFVSLYGLSELVIGISGLAVAPLLRVGRALLIAQGGHAAWGSSGYYLASGGWVALVMLPFCCAMGATFPLAMAGLRTKRASAWAFSFLYLANVVGAMAGALGSAFVFIELWGFAKTLLIAVAANGLVAVCAILLGQRMGKSALEPEPMKKSALVAGDAMLLPLLFTTGLSSLGMEVVWTRQFVPLLGPVVYSFATILAVYLFTTAVGSQVYRGWIRFGGGTVAWRPLVIVTAGLALLPLIVTDPRIPLRHQPLSPAVRVAWGIGWFCAVLGFLTPMLIDRWSSGDPDRAGRAYAVNALGCIVGPLVAGFVLLPAMGERWSLVALAIPFLALGLWGVRRVLPHAALAAVVMIAGVVLISKTRDYETLFPGSRILRDHTATVIATGTGMDKRLVVNGVAITNLTPITKMMAHLPLAYLAHKPQRVLVLCFGMGTSFRSALSWNVPVTAVELVPSVPALFSYFHADGDELLRSPQATVVIDDARRYLERTSDSFDAIVIDPPPPVEAAASSLLYSPEFYALARRRLRPGGILQQWLPRAEPLVISAFSKAIGQSFPHVRVFPSVEGWGYHFLASEGPAAMLTPAELAAKLPESATRDLLEWGPHPTAAEQFAAVVEKEVPLQDLVQIDPEAPVLTDDRPVNEYYFLRRPLTP